MTLPELSIRAREVTRQVRAIVVAAASAALCSIDTRDVHFYGGLLLAGFGGWRISPAWTLIVLGAVLSRVGLRGTR
jgi:hypothetical protein